MNVVGQWQPDIPPRNNDTVYGAYGALEVAAHYCGMPAVPSWILREWQHGWIGPERNVHPELVVGGNGKSRERADTWTFYVARQDQADYLGAQGYRHVHAIGLPMLYVDVPALPRKPGSLLVMPAHSLPDTDDDFAEDEYIDYIQSIAPRFSEVYFCVHQSCMDKGNWARAFGQQGIRVVAGASGDDANSLLRMAMLFRQFEYVTTNHLGSHVAYASYFGCKVSVAGPAYVYTRDFLKGTAIYRNSPESLDLILEVQHRWKDIYPQFYVDPIEATLQQGWAAWQLGEQCRRSPAELQALFRWRWHDRLYIAAKSALRPWFGRVYPWARKGLHALRAGRADKP